jgi:hypothetical protein
MDVPFNTTGGKNTYSANSLSNLGFRSASQISKALELLSKKELVARNELYSIQDVLFKLWIERIS